jgi:SPOR domain
VRTLALIVVLANVAFFAWSRYSGAPEGAGDPLPFKRQIEPEKLKVVVPGEPAPASAPRPTPQAAAPAPAAAKCVEWGSFTLSDAPRAEKALEPLALGPRVAQRRTEEAAAWWVYIPPQPNRQTAVRKAAELKALGVEDYFVVQEEGENRWALSLGVFRAEEAAQARLAALRSLGVRSARVRARETVVPKVWLQVKDVDAPLYARLRETARGIEGSELRECVQ